MLGLAVLGCGRVGFDPIGGAVDPEDWEPTAAPTPFVNLYTGPGYDWLYGITTRPNGDVIATGVVLDTIDFGGGPLAANGQTLVALRLGRDGMHVWSRSLTSTSGVMVGRAVTTHNGALSIGGHFSGTSMVGPASISAIDGQNYLVLDVTATGGMSPVAYAGATTGLNMQGYALAVSSDGRRAIGGTYGAPVQVTSTIALPPPLEADDGHVVVLDAAGVPEVAHAFPSPGFTNVNGVAFDGAGNLCVVGEMYGAMMIGGRTTPTLAGLGGFVAVYNVHQTLVSLSVLDAPMGAKLVGVAGLASGGFVVSGSADGGAMLAGANAPALGREDVVVARLDATGTPLWVRALGGTDDDDEARVAFAPNGEVVVIARFRGTWTIAGQTFVSAGGSDIGIVTLDPADGTPRRAWREGGASADTPLGVAVDAMSGDIVIVGTYEGDTVIGGRSATAQHYDPFVLRFSPL